MRKKLTPEEAAREAAEWAKTSEGRRAIQEADIRARELAERFRQAALVDARDLWRGWSS